MKTEIQDEIDEERDKECYEETLLKECGKPVTDYLQGVRDGYSKAKEEDIEIIEKFFNERIEWAKKPKTKLREALIFLYVQDCINLKKGLSK